MSNKLEYSFVYSQDARRSLYYLVHYAVRLCHENNISSDKIPMITYQLTTALADGKIVRSDIEFSIDKGITSIAPISIGESGSIVCDY